MDPVDIPSIIGYMSKQKVSVSRVFIHLDGINEKHADIKTESEKISERINEIRSTFYRFKVQNSYLLITNVTDVSFRSPFVFVKKAFVESNFAKKSS